MTTIKATCPSCGDVDLRPPDVTVTIAPAAGWATYRFICPSCCDEVTKSADDDVVTLLRGAGVRINRLRIPAEALEPRFGPPLASDDLIDFGVRLASADALVQVLLQESR